MESCLAFGLFIVLYVTALRTEVEAKFAEEDAKEEEKILQKHMKQYRYESVSDFICDAVLDKRLNQRQVVEMKPYIIDNNRIIPQVIDAIRTYDFRLVRAIAAFEEVLNVPYVDPELIHMHARLLRLIGAALGGKIEWLIRFMEGRR